MDGLKKATHKQKNGKSVGVLAREAIRWVQESLNADDGSVIAENTARQVGTGDDSILTYCLYPPLSSVLMMQGIDIATSNPRNITDER